MSTEQPSRLSYPEQLDQTKEQMESMSHAASATMQSFGALHKAATAASALDTKTKELIALAIAVSARCDGCIAFHAHDALQAGATRDEIADALGVAILMGGGPAMIYATHVWEAVAQFEQTKED
ncbi:MAG: carboxymuconolactone decarboxylase family protein [Burkholderiaceae bacterium]